jgi:hypothetical protein
MEMRQKKIVNDERMKELCKRHSIAFRAKKAKGERRKKRKNHGEDSEKRHQHRIQNTEYKPRGAVVRADVANPKHGIGKQG